MSSIFWVSINYSHLLEYTCAQQSKNNKQIFLFFCLNRKSKTFFSNIPKCNFSSYNTRRRLHFIYRTYSKRERLARGVMLCSIRVWWYSEAHHHRTAAPRRTRVFSLPRRSIELQPPVLPPPPSPSLITAAALWPPCAKTRRGHAIYTHRRCCCQWPLRGNGGQSAEGLCLLSLSLKI